MDRPAVEWFSRAYNGAACGAVCSAGSSAERTAGQRVVRRVRQVVQRMSRADSEAACGTAMRRVSASCCVVQQGVHRGNVWDSGVACSAGCSTIQQSVQRDSVWFNCAACFCWLSCGTTVRRVRLIVERYSRAYSGAACSAVQLAVKQGRARCGA